MGADEIDTSLRAEDLFATIKEENESTKDLSQDISLNLENMLEEIQTERESDQLRFSHHHANNDSCSIGLHTDESHDDDNDNQDEDQFPEFPQHIGSGLRLEDLPSPKSVDGWWNSGSSSRGFMGSFRKRMGGSLRKLNYTYQRRRKDASSKASSDDGEMDVPSGRKKKGVRFKKFDTIFTFYKSFSKHH